MMIEDPTPDQYYDGEDTQDLTSRRVARQLPRVPGLTVVAHPDRRRVGERVTLTALFEGRTVALSRLEPRFAQPAGGEPRPLAERHLSRQPLYLRPGTDDDSVVIDPASGRLPVRAGGALVTSPVVLSGPAVEKGVVLVLAENVVLLLHRLDLRGSGRGPRFGLVGESSSLRIVREQIERLAEVDLPVLIRGETGTGKELVARALHRAGRRNEKPFIAVDMGAVPPTLAAAELFGATKGAFTGADRAREGLFRQADGGTLFLDEIGETPSEVQAMLLRTLETGEVRPVGSERSFPVDVRLIAATDAMLEERVADGSFRAPLLHRLAGYPLHLPPLRDRRDDVGRLLFFFLDHEALQITGLAEVPPLPATLIARLAAHAWPGNVRELRNVARQLLLAARGTSTGRIERLTAVVDRALAQSVRTDTTAIEKDETDPVGLPALAHPRAAAIKPEPRRRPADIGDDELIEALEATDWRPTAAAKRLGITRPSLYNLMDRSERVQTAADLDEAAIEAARELHGDDLDAMASHLEVSRRGLARRLKGG